MFNEIQKKIRGAFGVDNLAAKKYVSFGLSLSSLLFPLWLFFLAFCINEKKDVAIIPIKLLSFEKNQIFEQIHPKIAWGLLSAHKKNDV